MHGGDRNAKDRVDGRCFETGGGDFHGVIVKFDDTRDVRNTSSAHRLIHWTPVTNERGFDVAINIDTIRGFIGERSGYIPFVSGNGFGNVVIQGRESVGQVPGRSGGGNECTGIIELAITPHGHGVSDTKAFISLDVSSGAATEVFSGVIIAGVIRGDVVDDGLYLTLPAFIDAGPEVSLLFLGPCIPCGPDVVFAGSEYCVR